jgi:hypothetical protein
MGRAAIGRHRGLMPSIPSKRRRRSAQTLLVVGIALLALCASAFAAGAKYTGTVTGGER